MFTTDAQFSNDKGDDKLKDEIEFTHEKLSDMADEIASYHKILAKYAEESGDTNEDLLKLITKLDRHSKIGAKVKEGKASHTELGFFKDAIPAIAKQLASLEQGRITNTKGEETGSLKSKDNLNAQMKAEKKNFQDFGEQWADDQKKIEAKTGKKWDKWFEENRAQLAEFKEEASGDTLRTTMIGLLGPAAPAVKMLDGIFGFNKLFAKKDKEDEPEEEKAKKTQETIKDTMLAGNDIVETGLKLLGDNSEETLKLEDSKEGRTSKLFGSIKSAIAKRGDLSSKALVAVNSTLMKTYSREASDVKKEAKLTKQERQKDKMWQGTLRKTLGLLKPKKDTMMLIAIGLVAAGLYFFGNKIVGALYDAYKWLGAKWEAFSGTIKEGYQFIVDKVSDGMLWISNSITSVFDTFMGGLTAILDPIKNLLTSIGKWFGVKDETNNVETPNPEALPTGTAIPASVAPGALTSNVSTDSTTVNASPVKAVAPVPPAVMEDRVTQINGVPSAKRTLLSSSTTNMGDSATKNIAGKNVNNNNPGNIKFGGFAIKFGATASDSKGLAIFPTIEAGKAAMSSMKTSTSDTSSTTSSAANTSTLNSNSKAMDATTLRMQQFGLAQGKNGKDALADSPVGDTVAQGAASVTGMSPVEARRKQRVEVINPSISDETLAKLGVGRMSKGSNETMDKMTRAAVAKEMGAKASPAAPAANVTMAASPTEAKHTQVSNPTVTVTPPETKKETPRSGGRVPAGGNKVSLDQVPMGFDRNTGLVLMNMGAIG